MLEFVGFIYVTGLQTFLLGVLRSDVTLHPAVAVVFGALEMADIHFLGLVHSTK